MLTPLYILLAGLAVLAACVAIGAVIAWLLSEPAEGEGE